MTIRSRLRRKKEKATTTTWRYVAYCCLLVGGIIATIQRQQENVLFNAISFAAQKNNNNKRNTSIGTTKTTSTKQDVVVVQQRQIMEQQDGKADDETIVKRPMGLKALKNRNEIGALLEEMKFEIGVEVGVQRGQNAQQILSTWPSCKEFHLVDLWSHQENYVDGANVNDAKHNQIYLKAQANLLAFKDKTTFHKMLSTEAAKQFASNTFDFAYIDARHDYCGVMEDLEAYWPLIRPGGVMAGHDYVTNAENKARQPNQDWGLCMDGTRHEGAVKGAVEDFALKHGLTITVMYDESGGDKGYIWKSWMVQKPWFEYHALLNK